MIGVAAAEVSVEPETGVVTVLRTATVADVGRAINPQMVERQDEGAECDAVKEPAGLQHDEEHDSKRQRDGGRDDEGASRDRHAAPHYTGLA